MRIKRKVKYLGLWLDDKMSFLEHIKETGKRVKKVVYLLLRVGYGRNSLSLDKLRQLYRGGLAPMLMYGCQVWHARSKINPHCRKIESAQRVCLVHWFGRYKSVSSKGIQVMTRIEPIDLLIDKIYLRYEMKKKGSIQIGKGEIDTTTKGWKSMVEKKLEECWQIWWGKCKEGRPIYDYIKDVEYSIKNRKWFKPYRSIIELISGHCRLNGYMHKRGFRKSARCYCGLGEETPEHVLHESPIYEIERGKWYNKMKKERLYN